MNATITVTAAHVRDEQGRMGTVEVRVAQPAHYPAAYAIRTARKHLEATRPGLDLDAAAYTAR